MKLLSVCCQWEALNQAGELTQSKLGESCQARRRLCRDYHRSRFVLAVGARSSELGAWSFTLCLQGKPAGRLESLNLADSSVLPQI